MLKKLLIVLPLVLLLELGLYISQGKEIKKLDQEAQLRKMSAKTFITPSEGFGDILARVNISVSEVLGESVSGNPEPDETTTPKKQSYVVAAIGDSMIETMGDSLDYLKVKLKEKYPGTEFAMYNYGVGAEKVTRGLDRLYKPFNHGTRNYPPLQDLKPDILIVGSYAYNPFDNYDRNGHWLALADLLTKARQISPNVYVLAEVAPVEKDFGTGPGGVNWPAEIVSGHIIKIIEQMENAIGLSKVLGIPLIDVYDKTREEGSKFGKSEYVSSHDNIHPSAFGQSFTAQEAANVIKLD